MSLQSLTPEEKKKAEAIREGLKRLTHQQRINLRDQLVQLEVSSQERRWVHFSRPDPTTFGTEVLNLRPNTTQKELKLNWYTDDQKRLFDAVATHNRVLALSGNGVGKSYSAAIISLWLYNRGYTVLTTAPTLAQVTDILWAEMRSMKANAMKGLGGTWQPKANKAEFGTLHFMQGFTVQTDMSSSVSTAFQGRHAPKMAIVLDEVIGMSASVIEACDRICVGPDDIIVGIGNPTDVSAPIRRAADVKRADGTPLWFTVHISGENHPNVVYNRTVIPGAVSAKMVADQLAKAGSRDGSIYKASVLGEWPDETPDTLIPREWILRAQERGRKRRDEDYRGKALGMDVAGEGGDMTPVFIVDRAKLEMPKLKGRKPWLVGRDVQNCVDLVEEVLHQVPDVRAIGIDSTGIGQGPLAILQRRRTYFPRYLTYNKASVTSYNAEHQATVRGLNFSSKAESLHETRFPRLKDQLYWELREAFRNNEIDLPTDEEIRMWELPSGNDFIAQLSNPIFVLDGQGRVVVLDKRGAAGGMYKEKTKQLPDKSPDLVHSLMIAWFIYARLPKGFKPIKDQVELNQIQIQIAKNKMKRRLLQHGPARVKGKGRDAILPWVRGWS